MSDSDSRYRQIFERANDAILLLDVERDAILDANDRACRLLEYPREELLALPISATHPGDIAKMREVVGSVLVHGSGWTNQLTCVTKSGQRISVEISASVLERNGQTCLLALVRDLSELQRQNERLLQRAGGLQQLADQSSAQLRRSDERHRVLLEVNNAVIGNLDQEALFIAIADALRNVLRFDRAGFTLADLSRGVSTVRAFVGEAPDRKILTVMPVGSEITNRGTPIGQALEERRPIVIPHWSQEPVVGPLNALTEQGVRSAIIVPLLSKRGPIGTVNMFSLTPDQYSDDDAEFLTEVGAQFAFAVENMLAHQEIARLKAQLELENLYLREEIKTEHPYEEIVGHSVALRKIAKSLETVAATDTTVLVTGETGTGKEVIARAVHSLSSRRVKTMVKVNCAALSPGLIESELFGHEKGAFTGAIARKIGRFEVANGSTIFLDEIGDLPMDLQAKLLRVLQEGEFERVGSTNTIKVNARVIAATNQDLDTAMREGRFRSDLYYRLSVFPIRLPPLRDRKEDIPPLVRHLVMKCCAKLARRIESIPQAAMDALCEYSWPGNVRELENVIELAVILSRGPRLDLGDWWAPAPVAAGVSGLSTLADVERRYIRDVLVSTRWVVSGEHGAAKLLGLRPTTLEARMKKLGITRKA